MPVISSSATHAMDLTYVSLIFLNFVLVAITYTNPAAAQLSKSVLGD